jgi:hypothetical protein
MKNAGWTRRRLCREELSLDVATTVDHRAADTAIGQITPDALHINVAGADNNRRTTKLPTQLICDFGRALDQRFSASPVVKDAARGSSSPLYLDAIEVASLERAGGLVAALSMKP